MRAPFQILAIPYKTKPELQYCVFYRNSSDQCQFVAGGGENNESPTNAAVREIKEETSIEIKHIIKLNSMAYIPVNVIPKQYRKQWDKNTFVIPEYTFGFECNSEINISHEHFKFEWLKYSDAIKKLTWDSNKTALFELNCLLQSKIYNEL